MIRIFHAAVFLFTRTEFFSFSTIGKRYFGKRCPTCGFKRMSHEYGALNRNVYVEGFGTVPCTTFKEHIGVRT